MNDNSKLDIILGPMFSGKTTKILEIMDAFDRENIKYIAVKPEIDDRYIEKNKNHYIVSHNLKKRECKVTSNLNDVFQEVQKKKTIEPNQSDSFQYIIIDEGQFFENLYNFCILCLEKLKINVIVTGLDGDYQRKPIGEILKLLPIANTITKLSSKCHICQKEAIFTHRLVEDSEQILIGGSDIYVPLCRSHYVEKNKLLACSLEF